METQETGTTQTRERRIAYYVTQKPVTFKTKREVEVYLTKEGGLKDDQILVKGSPVEASQEQVFRIS
jgi:hypothetical protein